MKIITLNFLVLLNVMLALLWMLMWGQFDVFVFTAGLALGYLLIALLGPTMGVSGYGQRVVGVVRFSLYFIRILVKSNLQVAWEVLTPGYAMEPRIVRYDVSELTPLQTTVLANTITLTPGTLSMDIDPDGNTLYVHCMYARDRASAIADLDDLRHRVIEDLFV